MRFKKVVLLHEASVCARPPPSGQPEALHLTDLKKGSLSCYRVHLRLKCKGKSAERLSLL